MIIITKNQYALPLKGNAIPAVRQATCNVNAEAILTKSCVVEGFVGQRPNADSNTPKIFLIFLLNLAHVFVPGT